MKQFTSVHDVQNLEELLEKALWIKKNPFYFQDSGKNKTVALIFLNSSLRTRLSMQKAAANLGMSAIVLNVAQESWSWELEDGAVMNGTSVEHIKDAAAVISQYCDIAAIRCFPSLNNQHDDYSEKVLRQFIKYCRVPVVSMESATRHPLQSFADLITIRENWTLKRKPNVVLMWAPHIKPLPQAVANSFSEWMNASPVNFSIAHPKGYDLHKDFSQQAVIHYNQDEALKNADFVYVKNWSAYQPYGQILQVDGADWMLTQDKMMLTNRAKIMHCLPVRRNVELSDELLDGEQSLVQQQAHNRIYAAQAVLKNILDSQLSQTNNSNEKEKNLHY